MSKTISSSYVVSIPTLATGTVAFSFTTTVNGETFTFDFRWDDTYTLWRLAVTMPDATIREAGVFAANLNWLEYDDYGLMFVSTLTSVGLNDLSNLYMLILLWG